MKPLVETNAKAVSTAILLLRLMSGLILFVAGAGKVMGWFGGMGMPATIEIFKSQMQLSVFWVYLSCYAELIGGFLLMIGLLTRVAAITLVVNMLVATLFVGFKNFFMGGAAYSFLLFVIFLVIILTGPMAYSIDAFVLNRKRAEKHGLTFSAAF